MTTPGQTGAPSTTEVLAATIAAAVERQLTQYASAMSQQVDAVRNATEQQTSELKTQLEGLTTRLEQQDQQLRTFQASIDDRLGSMTRSQQARLDELQSQLMELPTAGGGSTFDAALELATLRDQLDSQSAGAHARIDELHKATRRFDEQASELVRHVNDTTIALAQRMDEGNQALAQAVEERLTLVGQTLEAVGPELQRQLTDQAVMATQRTEAAEHRMTDRMLAMEERINEISGDKIATLEATVGRIGAGFDDAIGAMSRRLLENENSVQESLLRMGTLEEHVSKVDENAIKSVKDEISAAVGEAMLVRIELDRLGSTTNEKLDKTNLRMAEIEAQLADEMDVSAAVQLERLDELERAVVALDPSQFVRKSDPGAGADDRASSMPPPTPSADNSSEHSLSY